MPNNRVLPVLLKELSWAGVPDDHIVLVNALATHRPQTEAELRRAQIQRRARVRVYADGLTDEDQWQAHVLPCQSVEETVARLRRQNPEAPIAASPTARGRAVCGVGDGRPFDRRETQCRPRMFLRFFGTLSACVQAGSPRYGGEPEWGVFQIRKEL